MAKTTVDRDDFNLKASQHQRQVVTHWLSDNKWPIIGFLWSATIALGYLGLSNYYERIDAQTNKVHYWWDTIYSTFQLFTLQKGEVFGSLNWELQLARFLAPSLTIYTTLAAFTAIFREQIQLYHLRFLKKHIVVCGLGGKGLPLVEGFLEKGRQVVIIEKDINNSNVSLCREKGAFILDGNATDVEILRKARISSADYLVAACGEDGVNAEIAYHARSLVRNRRGNSLSCLIHIYDSDLCHLLQEWEFGNSDNEPFRLEYFNVFESGARSLLEQHKAIFQMISKSEYKEPHLVIIGLGQMGSSLLVNLVRQWQNTQNNKGRKLSITTIDLEAKRKTELLRSRYPEIDVYGNLLPRQMDVKSAEFEKADFLCQSKEWNRALAVFICMDNDSRSFSTALTLHNHSELNIPIIVRMSRESGLSSLLTGKCNDNYNIHSFSLLERTCRPDLIFGCMYETMARAIHNIYIENERNKGNTLKENPSMVPWEELPNDLKESNRAQAQNIWSRLRAIGYDLRLSNAWHPEPYQFNQNETKEMAELEHERFVKERLKQGWKLGPRDLMKKTNPTLKPFAELPADEQQKDFLFASNTSLIISRAGFEVYRINKENK
jgi:hypothetical protein